MTIDNPMNAGAPAENSSKSLSHKVVLVVLMGRQVNKQAWGHGRPSAPLGGVLLAILSSGPLAIHDLVSLVPLRSEKGSHLLQYVVYLSYKELYTHIFPSYEGLNYLKFSPVLFTGFRLPPWQRSADPPDLRRQSFRCLLRNRTWSDGQLARSTMNGHCWN